MKFAIVIAAFILSGCVSMADVKKQEPLFNGQVKGGYSGLARCVADQMQTDKRWTINALQYNVRVYPDVAKSEVQAHAHSPYTGAIYAFLLELKEVEQNVSHAQLRGSKYEGGVALETLQSCSSQS